MAFTDQVMIEFVPDTTGLDSAIEKLHAMGQVDQETYEQFKKNNAQFAERQKALEVMSNLQTKLNDKTLKSEKSLESLSKAAKGLSDNLLTEGSLAMFDQLVTKVNRSDEAMAQFNEGALQGMVEELDAAGVSVEDFAAGLAKLDGGTDATTNSSKSLKAELKELKMSLAALKVEGKSNTDEYQAMVQRAGELTDAIGDVNQEVARTGSDTSGLDKLISTSSAVIGGYQAMQGAMALVGSDNEDLQESFVRLQAGMSLLQGLQAIGNEIAREDSIIKKGLAVANTITAATQKALGIATVETSVAFKVLRGAIIATGIGALVVLVGLLIANWDQVKAKFIEVKDRAMELYEKLGIFKTVIQASIAPLVLMYKTLIAVGEAIGLLDDPATSQLKDDLELAADKSEQLKNSLSGQADLLEAIGGKSQAVLEMRMRSLQAEEDMVQKKLQLARMNDDEKQVAELTNDLHRVKVSQLKLEDEVMKSQVAKMREQGVSEKVILQYQKDRIMARINELEVIIKQAEAMKMLEGGLFDTLRDGFVSSVNLEIEALKNKMNTVQHDFDKSVKDTKKEVEKPEFIKIKPTIDPPATKEMIDAMLPIRDAMQEAMKPTATEAPKDRTGLESILEENNLKLQSDRLTASERAKIESNMLEQKRAFYADEYALLLNKLKTGEITQDEYYEQEHARQQKAAETEIEIENRKNQKIQAMKQALYQVLMQAAMEYISSEKDKNRQDLEDSMARINGEREAIEGLYKDKKISEDEYQKGKRILEKQEADAKRRQWQRDRELAMYEVGIKTVQAVITAFASSSPPASFILAAAAGAFGLAQEAQLAAKDPPKFAKGTLNAPPGWKWVGEEGPELINTPGGHQIKTHADSLAFANMFHRMDMLAGLSKVHVNERGDLVDTADTKMIGAMQEIGKKLDNITIQQHSFNRRGYESSIKEGNNTIYELGGRY